MPAYNAAPYLPQAIAGVLRQTYENLELVICDNQSTDDSRMVAEGFAEQDSRVRFYRNRANLGYAGNMQRTASLARGEYLLFHFADDGAEPDALRRLMDLALEEGRPDELIVGADAYIWSQQGEKTGVLTASRDRYSNEYLSLESYKQRVRPVLEVNGHAVLTAVMRRLEMYGFIGGTLFTRTLFEKAGEVNSTRGHNPDKQFLYKLLSVNPQVVRLQEPLFYLRIHDSNQHAQDRSLGVIKQTVDDYAYTYDYPESLLEQLGLSRRDLATGFIERSCLRKALAEIRQGAPLLGFRYVAFALATYPQITVRNPKFFAAMAGVMTGPLGRFFAEKGYQAGAWRGSGNAQADPESGSGAG